MLYVLTFLDRITSVGHSSIYLSVQAAIQPLQQRTVASAEDCHDAEPVEATADALCDRGPDVDRPASVVKGGCLVFLFID